ncbi:MAG: hypothetical protein KHX81_13570 [Clostridium sp.]|nr:hypothetical protein [Clostridium sp.]
MSYRKQISYLELQENGQRIRGAGYAKLESWEKEEILMVQLRGQGIVSGKEMLLYLHGEPFPVKKEFSEKRIGSRHWGYAFPWNVILRS